MAKMVDTKEYLDMVRGLLREGHTKVPVTVAGSSMSPFLHHGDTVYLSPLNESPRKGDIVLYTRPSGQYVLHRIVEVRKDGSYIMLGDAQTDREWIESAASIHGVVACALHKGQMLTPDSPRWRLFATAWLHVVPLRPALMKSWKVIARK